MEGNIKDVISYWFQGEIQNLIKVWFTVIISLCYCKSITRIFPKAPFRLFLFFPIISLFLILPLSLHTIHIGITSAFFIAWLSNFKLIMLAFGSGPLSDDLSFPRFLAVACLPIKIDTNYTPKSKSKSDLDKNPSLISISYAVKGVLIGLMIKLHDYSDRIHPYIISIMYCFHIYFALEIILAVAAAIAQKILGSELEPTFDEPLLSTSLQDFWGRRWNIMVNRILRPSVYDPLLTFSNRYLERQWAPLPAVFGTFVVSGLMHELIFYYMGRQKPTWKTSLFFMIHGTCVVVEVGVKKVLKGRWQMPKIVGRILAVGFVISTGLWLFLPDMLRLDADVRAFQEYAAVGEFVKDIVTAFTIRYET